MNFAGNLIKAARGIVRNPGSAGINLFGTNVPLVPLVSYRNHFLRQLETWSGSIPNQFMWLLLFDNFPAAVSTSMLQHHEPVGEANGIGNNIDKNLAVSTDYLNQRVAGCVFAQGVALPGETVGYNRAKVANQRGFIGGLHTDTRQDFEPLTIQFLETNTSFIDFVIRPWTILTGHLGLVARPGDIPENGETDIRNIKTNITVIQLAKTYQQRSSVQRKVWRFYNVTPASLDQSQLSTNGTDMQLYNTSWFYSHYTVGGLPFIPVEEIVKNFSSGKLTGIIRGITQVTGIDPVEKAVQAAKNIAGGVFGR